jgi:hypothetical protein
MRRATKLPGRVAAGWLLLLGVGATTRAAAEAQARREFVLEERRRHGQGVDSDKGGRCSNSPAFHFPANPISELSRKDRMMMLIPPDEKLVHASMRLPPCHLARRRRRRRRHCLPAAAALTPLSAVRRAPDTHSAAAAAAAAWEPEDWACSPANTRNPNCPAHLSGDARCTVDFCPALAGCATSDCNPLQGNVQPSKLLALDAYAVKGDACIRQSFSLSECCSLCKQTRGCNAWSFCNNPDGEQAALQAWWSSEAFHKHPPTPVLLFMLAAAAADGTRLRGQLRPAAPRVFLVHFAPALERRRPAEPPAPAQPNSLVHARWWLPSRHLQLEGAGAGRACSAPAALRCGIVWPGQAVR